MQARRPSLALTLTHALESVASPEVLVIKCHVVNFMSKICDQSLTMKYKEKYYNNKVIQYILRNNIVSANLHSHLFNNRENKIQPF